jgi:hypothetical protein
MKSKCSEKLKELIEKKRINITVMKREQGIVMQNQ